MSWSRASTAASADVPAAPPRGIAQYSAEALPERQPALATLLPTSLGGLAGVAASILVVIGLTAGPSVAEAVLARPLVTAGGRFAGTVAAIRGCVDLHTTAALAAWLGQMLLVTAAIVSLIVRLMRRHRRDDFNGRYRAWGWMAAAFLMAAAASQVPFGGFVAAFMADATGLTFGPGGLGWWIAITTVALGGIALWAVLPLHDRLATALWLTVAYTAWAAAAACTWMAAARSASGNVVIVGHAAWALGSALACIAMLTAARSVIREVRGEAGQPARAKPRATAPDKGIHDDDTPSRQATRAESDEDASSITEFVDGSEEDDRGSRHLSKAERKRLKKMARLQRAG